ncbi:MAG: hypothetical protein ACOY3P_10735 [Planctomycetota bacterium]
MKGIMGLAVAAALGIAAAIFNFAYLTFKAQQLQTVSFVGIKPEVTVDIGDILREEHVMEVPVPQPMSRGLEAFAVKWSARASAVGGPVARTITGPRLLLEDDCRTPPVQELKLGPDEFAIGVPVDPRENVLSFIRPGEMVSFVFARGRPGEPTPAMPPDASAPAENGGNASSAARGTSAPIEIIGPFKVLSLGNRLGSFEVHQAARLPRVQENMMMIAVKLVNNRLEPRAEQLVLAMQTSDSRGVRVLLHSDEKAGGG